MHCATTWEVAVSIPDRIFGNLQVTGSFYVHLLTLWFTQPPREMSTMEFPWV